MAERRFLIVAAAAAAAAVGLGGLFALSGGAVDDTVLDAQAAYDKLNAGELILIDIRTPQEWQQTGVVPGAWMLDMRDKQFGSYVMAALDRNPDHEVAIICRTGSRTGRVVKWLNDNGVKNVRDVAEGMLGGPRGQGWLPRGLPVVPAEEAFAAMPKDLRVQ